MESYQLAKANIKILDIYMSNDDAVWVRFSYQWRDKHRQPQWAEDVVCLTRSHAHAESIREAVYNTAQAARAKLEARED